MRKSTEHAAVWARTFCFLHGLGEGRRECLFSVSSLFLSCESYRRAGIARDGEPDELSIMSERRQENIASGSTDGGAIGKHCRSGCLVMSSRRETEQSLSDGAAMTIPSTSMLAARWVTIGAIFLYFALRLSLDVVLKTQERHKKDTRTGHSPIPVTNLATPFFEHRSSLRNICD